MEKVYGVAVIGYCTVKKWVSRIKGEEEDPTFTDLQDKQKSKSYHQRLMPGNWAKVEELIRKDRRVAIDGIAEHIGLSHGSAAKIVEKLNFAKICARWV